MDGAESVGNAVCLAAGFNGGARVIQNKHKTHERDAIPVSCHECCPSLLHCKPSGLHPRVYSQMIKIAKCDPGQSLLSCLNARHKRDEDIPDVCKAGNAVGVEIACNYQVQDVWRTACRIVLGSLLVLLQCRPFSVFNEKRLQTCHPYLKSTTHYYLVRRGGVKYHDSRHSRAA